MIPEVKELLKYIVSYRRLRGHCTKDLVLEELVLQYAKELAVGMPEELWHRNMLVLIDRAQTKHGYYKNYRQKILKSKLDKAKELGIDVDNYILSDKSL